jgi:hypothetical protein
MGLEDVILVGSVREKVRTHALTANSAVIMDRIKAWGSVEPREGPVGVPTPVFAVPPPVPVEDLGTPQPADEPEWVEPGWVRPEPPADRRWGGFY